MHSNALYKSYPNVSRGHGFARASGCTTMNLPIFNIWQFYTEGYAFCQSSQDYVTTCYMARRGVGRRVPPGVTAKSVPPGVVDKSCGLGTQPSLRLPTMGIEVVLLAISMKRTNRCNNWTVGTKKVCKRTFEFLWGFVTFYSAKFHLQVHRLATYKLSFLSRCMSVR